MPPEPATLLVCDDQAFILDILAAALREAGFRVIATTDAREALAIAGETRLHGLVTDLVMPGLSGSELARAVRGLHADLPVLYVSGYGNIACVLDARREAFVAKPFDFDELFAVTQRLFGRQPSPPRKAPVPANRPDR